MDYNLDFVNDYTWSTSAEGSAANLDIYQKARSWPPYFHYASFISAEI